jgi:hypothetical protein
MSENKQIVVGSKTYNITERDELASALNVFQENKRFKFGKMTDQVSKDRIQVTLLIDMYVNGSPPFVKVYPLKPMRLTRMAEIDKLEVDLRNMFNASMQRKLKSIPIDTIMKDFVDKFKSELNQDVDEEDE